MGFLRHHDEVDGLHYLDDFLVLEKPAFTSCVQALHRALAQCTNT